MVHGEDFVILACTVLIQLTSVTDRQMDGRPDDGKDTRGILLSHIKVIYPSQINENQVYEKYGYSATVC